MTADAAGTAVFPTACPRGYESVNGAMVIDAGGTSVVVGQYRLRKLTVTGTSPGPGGDCHDFSSWMDISMRGNGPFLGYSRSVTLPVTGRMLVQSQTPGEWAQEVDAELLELSGLLPAPDPDFDVLRITAGSDLGLPSPGHTTLTRLASGDWAVDSFFDVTYRIDYDTTPGSLFGGVVGTTTSATRIRDGLPPPRAYGLADAGGTAPFPPPCDDGFQLQGFRSQGFTAVMSNGLPAGSPVIADLLIRNFLVTGEIPGGDYGDALQDFTAEFVLDLHGTGAFAGFHRRVVVPVTGRTQTGAHGTGLAVQGFPSDLVGLNGQITGDPDFDLLRIQAGPLYALPACLGHTTVTLQPSGADWTVDSFLDITWRIDFVGSPGGTFSGANGSTTGAEQFVLGMQEPNPCVVPDVGGTARVPVACAGGYRSGSDARVSLGGLPPGEPLLGRISLDILNVTQSAGGSLGGHAQSFSGNAVLEMHGIGSLAGFSRTLTVPINGSSSSAPRGGGATPQSFETEIGLVFGQVTGDPDFDLLRIQAGSSFGMPSPGHTVFTRRAGGDWLADSFFDVTYQIEFNGAPGGTFPGIHSITRSVARFRAGATQSVGVGPPAAVEFRVGPPIPNPAHGGSRVEFELPRAVAVEAEVLDVAGRRVRQLARGEFPAGHHALRWDGRGQDGRPVSRGLYFYRLILDGRPVSRKLVLGG